MNDAYDALEKELRSLTPRRLSERTRCEIARKLDRPRGVALLFSASGGWQWAAAAAVAAALLVGIGWFVRGRHHSGSPEGPAPTLAMAERPAAPELAAVTAPEETPEERPRRIVVERIIREPVSIESVLVSERDEGPVVLPGLGPARRVRCRYVDRVAWRRPDRQASYTMTAPREEVVLMTVDTY